MKKTREGFGRALVDAGRGRPQHRRAGRRPRRVHHGALLRREVPRALLRRSASPSRTWPASRAGLAAMGKIPFFATYGAFAACRAADQLRVSVAYSNLNVKIGGAHGGISVGPDGATHQAMEEFAIIRSHPQHEPGRAVRLPRGAQGHHGRGARRRARSTSASGARTCRWSPTRSTPFTFGKGEVFGEGERRHRHRLRRHGLRGAARRARRWPARGISARVVNLHTIKPLDAELIVRCARETGAIVTAEEHQVNGGLGGAVAEVRGARAPGAHGDGRGARPLRPVGQAGRADGGVRAEGPPRGGGRREGAGPQAGLNGSWAGPAAGQAARGPARRRSRRPGGRARGGLSRA